MHKTVKFLLAILLCVSMFSLAACGGNAGSTEGNTENPNSEVNTQDSEIESEIESESEEIVQEPENVNPLTGVADLSDEAIGKRPVAVMVNNIKQAFPQYGIAQADVIFEMPVEDRSTRFMAMYGDYTKVPKICSVRSCRSYFPVMSESFDAIYVHWGMGAGMESYVKSLGLTKFDGITNDGNMFGRDKEMRDKGYALEHTGYFDGTKLPGVLEKRESRIDIEADKAGYAFNFHPYGTVVTPTGTPCTIASVDFGITVSKFTYDPTTDTYFKEHNNAKHMDGVTGTQLNFTNVIVLETSVTMAENGVHRVVEWHGGNGYYVSNGMVQKITWSKADEQSKLLFFDEAGNPLVINRGKTYIGVNHVGEATFE